MMPVENSMPKSGILNPLQWPRLDDTEIQVGIATPVVVYIEHLALDASICHVV